MSSVPIGPVYAQSPDDVTDVAPVVYPSTLAPEKGLEDKTYDLYP